MAEWLRAVIAFGSGVAGLSAPYPHPHSTHAPMLVLPVLFVSLTRNHCCSLHAQEVFPHAGEGSASSSAHHFGCVLIRAHMRSCFPSRRGRVRFSSCTGHCAAGSHAVGKGASFQWSFTISTERNRVCFLLRFVVWCNFPRAQTVWGRFPML